MKFTQIPEDGASWQGPLRYRFSNESIVPEDMEIVIVDETTAERLGTMHLYSTCTGDIDIAPYLRAKMRLTPTEASRDIQLVRSPSAVAVSVVVNGVKSEVGHFFRSKIDYNRCGSLSYHVVNHSIVRGDAIRLTLFAKSSIEVVVSYVGPSAMSPTRITLATHGLPAELIIPTAYLRNITSVDVHVSYDGGTVQNFNYVIEPGSQVSKPGSLHLVWYNPQGGIESYMFNHSVRLGYAVSSEDIASGNNEIHKHVDGRQRYRICTGYDTTREIARVVELLLSPMVFSEKMGVCTPIVVENREVNFDSKGLLHSFAIDISEEWKGGGDYV